MGLSTLRVQINTSLLPFKIALFGGFRHQCLPFLPLPISHLATCWGGGFLNHRHSTHAFDLLLKLIFDEASHPLIPCIRKYLLPLCAYHNLLNS